MEKKGETFVEQHDWKKKKKRIELKNLSELCLLRFLNSLKLFIIV